MAELEQIVTRLEKGDATLEGSIEIYERGEALRRHCEQLLHAAEMRIELITLGPDGKPTGRFASRSGMRSGRQYHSSARDLQERLFPCRKVTSSRCIAP